MYQPPEAMLFQRCSLSKTTSQHFGNRWRLFEGDQYRPGHCDNSVIIWSNRARSSDKGTHPVLWSLLTKSSICLLPWESWGLARPTPSSFSPLTLPEEPDSIMSNSPEPPSICFGPGFLKQKLNQLQLKLELDSTFGEKVVYILLNERGRRGDIVW